MVSLSSCGSVYSVIIPRGEVEAGRLRAVFCGGWGF